MNFAFTNTLTKKKESFIPLQPGRLSLYVCGITPYDYAHIGHGRVYVSFDVLVRLFKAANYDVTYVRNVTDVDDKLINKAEKMIPASTYTALAEHFTALFENDMQQLNCLTPTHQPKVTHNIEQIIEFVDQLIKKKHAYVVEHDVYFDISTFHSYGKLSGRCADDLLAGARVEINENKKNPGDFALWKGSAQGTFWKSPWGWGRPGWHIECSVMAKRFLGESFDIHAGGMDLIFPHHENEITQSESLHDKPFANYWLHNAFVNINKEKMSKSIGNTITLHAIFKQHNPMVLRLFYLQHHYRTPIDFSDNELLATKTAYKKLVTHFHNQAQQMTVPFDYNDEVCHQLRQALSDDLNTPKALGIIFENITTIKNNPAQYAFVKMFLQDIFGLTLAPLVEEQCEITPEIQSLLDQRDRARAAKDWQQADAIRHQLAGMGFTVQDKKS